MSRTDYLDVVGAACLVLFAFAIWPPLSLLAFGLLALAASYVQSRKVRP